MSTAPIAALPAYLEEVLRLTGAFKATADFSEIDGLWFRGASDRGRGLLPGTYWRKDVNEGSLMVDFIDQAPPYFDALGVDRQTPPTSLWDWYFLMQHYGMPTRLLDWTENALVALYFAVSTEGPQPCVWMMDPAQFNKITTGDSSVISPGGEFSKYWLPIASEDQDAGCRSSVVSTFDYKGQAYSNEKPIAIFAARRNARILAQQGTFTVHGAQPVSIHKVVPTHRVSPLACIDIDATARQSLLKDLEFCGVAEYRLFPELERLAPYIKRRHHIIP